MNSIYPIECKDCIDCIDCIYYDGINEGCLLQPDQVELCPNNYIGRCRK